MSKSIRFALQELPKEDINMVQLIRKGKFNHALYGKFDINEDVLREFKANFDNKARRVDIAVDYFHESYAEAAGWIERVELRDNDKSLWIDVKWTESAKVKILDKQIRYISADFDLAYEDSETGKEYGATLYGAGLTNRPHVKDMQPIFSDEIVEHSQNKTKKEDKAMTLEFNDILDAVSNLSEDEKLQLGEKLGFSVKASEVEKKLSDAETAKTLAEDKAKTEIKTLSDENAKLKSDIETKDKENVFTIMLAEGKVVEAQRKAYTEGDMATFAKNAVSVNLDESGSGAEGDSETEANTAQVKLNELATNKSKDEGITFSEAYKAVAKANTGLFDKASA